MSMYLIINNIKIIIGTFFVYHFNFCIDLFQKTLDGNDTSVNHLFLTPESYNSFDTGTILLNYKYILYN